MNQNFIVAGYGLGERLEVGWPTEVVQYRCVHHDRLLSRAGSLVDPKRFKNLTFLFCIINNLHTIF